MRDVYLTTHSTRFIYGYMALHMVKNHSDNEKMETRLPYIVAVLSTDYPARARFMIYAPLGMSGLALYNHYHEPALPAICITTYLIGMSVIPNERTDESAPERIDEGRKEMLYITTHSAHFVNGYM